jgi:hypothetical protein
VLLHVPQDGGHRLWVFGKCLVEQRGNFSPALGGCHPRPFELFVQPHDNVRRVPQIRSERRHVRIQTGGFLQVCVVLNRLHTCSRYRGEVDSSWTLLS